MQDLRLGVDVGGTNTDAVMLNDNGRVQASAKTPTTPDVTTGIIRAIDMVLAAGVPSASIRAAMLGTTQCINAILERQYLGRVGVIRLGAPATLAPARTALVVIDMTRGVLSMPTVPHPIEEVLANTVRLADAFRSAGGFVVLVNVNSVERKDMLHPISDTKLSLSAERPKGWAELAPELGPQPLDHLISKHQWGAFFGTDLQLCRRGIDIVILCGIATGFGVDTTALEAYQHGYNQVFAEDAMNALSEEEHHYVCTHIFLRMGRLRSTDEIVAALQATEHVSSNNNK